VDGEALSGYSAGLRRTVSNQRHICVVYRNLSSGSKRRCADLSASGQGVAGARPFGLGGTVHISKGLTFAATVKIPS
jgi:hypothetical protein